MIDVGWKNHRNMADMGMGKLLPDNTSRENTNF